MNKYKIGVPGHDIHFYLCSRRESSTEDLMISNAWFYLKGSFDKCETYCQNGIEIKRESM